MIEVVKSGFFSTIQDLGRYGFAHLGVPVSGAMDQLSAVLANELISNDCNAAVIEMTLVGGIFKFNGNTNIAITGAHMFPKLNGATISAYKPIKIIKGDVLSFSAAKHGCRTYLAISGGIKTKKLLNSRSFFESVTGRSSLKNGDMLPVEYSNQAFTNTYSKIKNLSFEELKIDVFAGPEFECLSQEQQELMLNSEYTVSNLNNRMGYQLNELIKNELKPIITSAVLPGTVQLTPNGTLIILMRDAQTTGGYPRVLQLSDKAINLLAQKKTGDELKFSLIE